jgi:hypothetical protein
MQTEYGNGSWAVIDGLLKVRTAYGSKAAQLGDHSPEGRARIMVRELYEDELAGICF